MLERLISLGVGVVSSLLMIGVFVLTYMNDPSSMAAAGGNQDWIGIIVFFVVPTVIAMALIVAGSLAETPGYSLGAIGMILAGFLGTWIFTSGPDGHQVSTTFMIYCVYGIANIILLLIVALGIEIETRDREDRYRSTIRSERRLAPGDIDPMAYGNPDEIDRILAKYGMVLEVSSFQEVEEMRMGQKHVGDREWYTVDDYGNPVDLVKSEEVYEYGAVPVTVVKEVHSEYPTGASGLMAGSLLSIKSPRKRATVYCYSMEPYMKIIVGEYQNGVLIPRR